MAKIDITSKEAVRELNKIIANFVKMRKEITGVGDGSVKSFRKMATSLKELSNQEKEVLAQLRQYDKALKNMTKSQRNFKTQTRNLKEELKRTNEELRAAQAELQKLKQNKNIFSGAIGSVKRLIAAFGVLTGIQLFARAIGSAFNLTKQLDSLGFAMKAVITDSQELAQTQVWLADVTDRFGAELITTTNRFIKFRAASKNAGLSAGETQKIFGTMTKVAGVLGLRTDELTGIFLALEQMVSKGKVTTEELRRQLGERLPGAMDILANSMNVTTSELDEMMKKGLVITKDVLPGFADEVNKAFGLDSVNTVETLQAATIRLKNAWTTLIQDFNEGSGVSQKLMKIIDLLADNLQLVVKVTLSFIASWTLLKTVLLATRTAIGLVQLATAGLNGVTAILTGTTIASTTATQIDAAAKNANTAATVTLSTATKGLITAVRTLWATLAANPWGLAAAGAAALLTYLVLMRDSFIESTTEIQKQDQALSDAARKSADLAINNGSLIRSYKDLKSQLDSTKEGTKEYKKIEKELNDVIVELGKNIPIAVDGVNQYGNAIKLNLPAAERWLEIQRENAGLDLKIAAGSEQKVLDDTEAKLKELNELKENGTKIDVEGVGVLKKIDGEIKRITSGRGGGGVFALTPAEQKALNDYEAKLLLLKTNAEDIIEKNRKAEADLLFDPDGKIKEAVEKGKQISAEAEKIKLAFQKSQTIEGIDEQIQQLDEDIKKVYTNVSNEQEQEKQNIEEIRKLQEKRKELQDKKNRLLGIENTKNKETIRALKQVRDIQEKINALLDKRKVLENQIKADDETLNVDIREDAAKRAAYFEIQQSKKIRDQKIADAQLFLDEQKRINKELRDEASSPERKEEIDQNTAARETEFLQKKEFAEKEHTNRVIVIVNRRNQKLLALQTEAEKDQIEKIQGGFDEELTLVREKYNELDKASKQRENAAIAKYRASEKTLKDEIELEKAVADERKNRAKIAEDLAREEAEIEFYRAKAIIAAQIAIAEARLATLDPETQGAEIAKLKNQIAGLKAAMADLKFPEPDEENVKRWQESLLEIIDAAEDFMKSVGAIFDAISERRIENIEAEIRKSAERFDKLIAQEEGNELQQKLLRRAKEAEEKRLRKKKLKEEQKAAKRNKVISIAEIQLNLARTITAHNLAGALMNATPAGAASLGFLGRIYKAIEIPLAIASAGAQTAAVLAQPIPQYAEGGKITSDHLGMINDAGEQEYIQRANQILTTDKENAIIPLKTGDVIYKDYDELAEKSLLLTGIYKGMQIDQREFNVLFDNIEKSIEKGFKKAKISTNVKVVGFDPEYVRYKESLTDWSK